MKKIVYYISFLLLLFLISIIPTSAKEFKTCARTTTNLRVREYFVRDDNLNAILETPCVDEVDKIYDFADLLTDLEEEELYKHKIESDKKCTMCGPFCALKSGDALK